MSLFLSKGNATQYALKGMREIFNNQDNNSIWRYSWFSRDVTNFQCSKPGGLQKFYLHLRKDFLKIYIFTIP